MKKIERMPLVVVKKMAKEIWFEREKIGKRDC